MVLMYHLVFLAKYRRSVFDDRVDEQLKQVCLKIEKRYQLKFLEIGTDKDHVHFLLQMLSITGNIERAGFSEKIQPQINAKADANRSGTVDKDESISTHLR